ncbi:dipeptide/oligopeptide/nickel ABC transporter permease/ATP-binding protein [Paenibacillus thalictri]|uniref:Dipeptide/oligopeptide/nickel ABC transporter permease/ATP-binding protein n=1 Tax=Paenibacillus thalictri TaxID=2527873 RepID=A0A4Q9DSI6_9BACL|nr:dipeptide/oligopeptide/nickel ABC transporter permease/ATP-binding protein [Paenibacillus thalictri]TBL77292.1 dipeptide/oligopeptide/nickel ABC transporter permease/ATP-binding protein [Paenibacillus thalictri]
MRKLFTHKMGLAGILLLALIFMLAILGPLIVPYDAAVKSGGPLEPPSQKHLLGTNDVGQDILAELVSGARISLTIGITSALLATLIGAVVGLLAGYWSGWCDALLMRVVDVTMTLPYLPLMIVIGVYIGPSLYTQILVITLAMWAGKARELRAQILSVRSRGPVLAARTMGGGHLYILRRHIFPAVMPLLIPQFVRAINSAIMMESSLSFLGLGDPLAKSWGSMLFYANARSAFQTDAWLWWVLPPGLCIVITVLGFSFVGYVLEERFSPRLRVYSFGSAMLSRLKKQAAAAASAFKPDSEHVLEVERLTVAYPKDGGIVQALNAVSFSVRKGEIVGIVGESGSGKTTIGSAVMQLLKPPAQIEGSIRFAGEELSSLSPTQLQKLRGSRIALIPQAAMNALNPVLNIRRQMAEAILAHRSLDKAALQRRINELLVQVGLDPKWGSAYPHELSGGMRQRVVIAMALVNEPELVIADEPTTGLDVLVQTEIITLLDDLQKKLGLSMIFISHDLPVVLRLADRILIMNRGEIVDRGKASVIAQSPEHPYTQRLLAAIPRLRRRAAAQDAADPTSRTGGIVHVGS